MEKLLGERASKPVSNGWESVTTTETIGSLKGR